ncbi:hypothetical protein RvY_02284 [Ramazzottius varieornatus]|uniref:Uncharacterized protein n=1 Tax=Ramazzottius varieornatus TaxID=947166 RepID=A0A1D1UTR9_RAMVA|nr:hypothetical protein RvY_02284 [Ramazzottius varieornatus]
MDSVTSSRAAGKLFRTLNVEWSPSSSYSKKFQTGKFFFLPPADFFKFRTLTFGVPIEILSSLATDGDGGGTQLSENVVKSTTDSLEDVLVEGFLPIFCVSALRCLLF